MEKNDTARALLEELDSLLEKIRKDGHILWTYGFVKEWIRNKV